MTLKKAYCYLFYQFYRAFETSPVKRASEWKASLCITVLIGFLVLAFGGYYTICTKRNIFPGNPLPIAIAIIAVVYGLNYYLFCHNDAWKEYVREFNKWPKRKNNIGRVIARLVIFLIIANLIFMFYLMSQVNWKQYR